MLGCCRRLVARASRRKRDTKCPSPASAAWRILRASRRPRFTRSGRYTSPPPPPPSVLQLAAQLDDEVVHRAVGRVALDPPDLVEDRGPRHRLVGALVQELERLD